MHRIVFALFVACLLILAAIAVRQETRQVHNVDFSKKVEVARVVESPDAVSNTDAAPGANEQTDSVESVDEIVAAANAYRETVMKLNQAQTVNSRPDPDDSLLDPYFSKQRPPDSSETIDGYLIEIWERRVVDEYEDGGIRISRNDQIVFTKAIYSIKVDERRDVTGNGRKEIVLDGWSGGANCCGVQYIVSTEPEFSIVSVMSPVLTFSERNYEPRTATQGDRSVRYVFSCGACVEYPEIQYRLTDTGWVPDPQAMRENAPSTEEINNVLKRMEKISCSSFAHCPATDNTEFTSLLLKLTYADKLELALEFIDRHASDATRDSLRADFARGLSRLPTTAMLFTIFGWSESDLDLI